MRKPTRVRNLSKRRLLGFRAGRRSIVLSRDLDQIGPLKTLRALLPLASVVHAGMGEQAPRWKGAYALMIHLSLPMEFLRPQARQRLDAGWYVYAGSAYGPGGVGARLRRHFRREKTLRWHVDHLTTIAERTIAVAVEGGAECAIVARLLRSPEFVPALKQFGSSDCRSCRSHLLKWDSGGGRHDGGGA